jgi:hypothetical protein
MGFCKVSAPSVQFFKPQMMLAVGKKWFHETLHLIPCNGFLGLGLLTRFLHKLITSISVLVSGPCVLYHNLYCIFSCYLPQLY